MYEQIKSEMEAWFTEYNNLLLAQEKFLFTLLNKLKDTAIGKDSLNPLNCFGDDFCLVARKKNPEQMAAEICLSSN